MTRKLTLLALFASCGLHGAIKKAEDLKPSPPAAAKPPAKTAEKPADKGDDNWLMGELRKRAQKDGGQLKMDGKEFLDLLRTALAKKGVPAEKLKSAKLPDLLKLVQESYPDVFKGMQLRGQPGMGTPPFSKQLEKKLTDHFNQLIEGHKPGAVGAAPAAFALRDGKKPAEPLAFGTGVNAGGWFLTKASEVKGAAELQCQIKGEWLDAKIVRVWADHDLALAKVAAKDMPAVKWATGVALALGSFITAVAPEGRDPVAIGVISVAVRNEQSKGRGFLGVSLTSDEKGLKVREVVAGGPAKASGLQREDRILELDGQKPDSVFTFTKSVSDRKAGDKVRLKLQRGDAVMEKEIALGDRGSLPGAGRSGFDKMNGMGSTVSKRKGDFPSVLQTDLPLQATQCGGPVTDLDGNVVGLVIARSGRVDTMVIPSETIRQLLDGVDFSKEEKSQAAEPAPAK